MNNRYTIVVITIGIVIISFSGEIFLFIFKLKSITNMFENTVILKPVSRNVNCRT